MMDAQFWLDLAMAIPVEVIPVSALFAMVDARLEQAAGIEPGFYP